MANEQYGSWHADNEFQPLAGSGIVNVEQGERIASAAIGAWLLSSSLNNLFKHPLNSIVKMAVGGMLLYRGASGHCPVYSSIGKTKGVTHTPAINIRTSLIVNKPKDEVYSFWRKLENLPLFMKHLASVTEIDTKHSHWEAVIPGNIGRIKWNAEIVKEEPGYLIGWQSIPNSMINNAGRVTFHDAANGQGTELEVVISYHPPAGELGAGLAKALNGVFEKIIRQDVMNFKEYIETKHKSTTPQTASATAGQSGSGDFNSISHGNTGSGSATGSAGNAANNPNILRTESQSVNDGSGNNNPTGGGNFDRS
jgi:uncharacterized membrane protein